MYNYSLVIMGKGFWDDFEDMKSIILKFLV